MRAIHLCSGALRPDHLLEPVGAAGDPEHASLAVPELLRGHLQNGRHAWLLEHLNAHHDPPLLATPLVVADEHHGDVASRDHPVVATGQQGEGLPRRRRGGLGDRSK